MAETALVVQSNLSHNVSVRIEEAKTRLSHLATVYLVTEVAGQSQATVDAKQRDLQRFPLECVHSDSAPTLHDSRCCRKCCL